jgi:hypothetical protein
LYQEKTLSNCLHSKEKFDIELFFQGLNPAQTTDQFFSTSATSTIYTKVPSTFESFTFLKSFVEEINELLIAI